MNQESGVRSSTLPGGPPGALVLRDCDLRGDRTPIAQGVRVGGPTELLLERCTIEDFGQGVWAPVSSAPPELALTIRDCRVNDNVGHGLYGQSPFVEIDGSEFRGNGVFGAELRGSGQVSVVRDCLITGNGRAGLQLVGFASATIDRCTIASNGESPSGGGIEVQAPAGTLHLSRTIVWGNCSAGGAEIAVPGGVTLELDCVDLELAAIEGGGTVVLLGEVIETDPLFCDPVPCGVLTPGGLYTLQRNSPASLVACGPIGALGIGCEAPTSAQAALELRSWGTIKGLYR